MESLWVKLAEEEVDGSIARQVPKSYLDRTFKDLLDYMITREGEGYGKNESLKSEEERRVAAAIARHMNIAKQDKQYTVKCRTSSNQTAKLSDLVGDKIVKTRVEVEGKTITGFAIIVGGTGAGGYVRDKIYTPLSFKVWSHELI